jgi:proteasome beta subunit
MSLPLFPPDEDPGPSFADVLARTAPWALPAGSTAARRPRATAVASSWAEADPRYAAPAGPGGLSLPHGTTIAALRYAAGVVVAGDRRATEGVSIAHRGIEKVFPADRFSAVAIAGTAGPAIEMVRLFQTQLEHYEKVEGAVLSLEGKANQLAQMVRANLAMAMQGLVVVPLFAGWDQRRQSGRIFTYDVTGGRYEETEFHATGSGGRDAKTTIKLGYRDGLTRDDAVELVVEALYQAADEDAATGGPDPVRGIYPIVATVDAAGFERLEDSEVAERFAAVLARRRRVEPEGRRREDAGDARRAAPGERRRGERPPPAGESPLDDEAALGGDER